MIRDLIIHSTEKKQLTFKQVCQATEVSPSTLSNFLRGRHEINLYALLKIVRYLFPEKEKEIMLEYCKELRKPENFRLALEYASMQNLTPLFGQLVESQKQSNNATNREWARIYELEYKWKVGDLQPHELVQHTKKLRAVTAETMFMVQWFDYFYYNYSQNFGIFSNIVENMEGLICNIYDPFLRKCYFTRYHNVLANKYFFMDEIEKSRHHAWEVINYNISPEKVARMYHCLGLSYIFEDGEKALAYTKIAQKIFKEIHYESEYINIEKSLFFISNYWGKGTNIFFDFDDPGYKQEVAFYEIKQGNVKKAKSILEKIDENSLSIRAKAFQKFYLGLCENNKEYFYISLMLFNQCGDKFFGKLPGIELLKNGENEVAVTSAYGKPIHSYLSVNDKVVSNDGR